MKWHYDDGGRSEYYKTYNVRDCVTRAIAIANNMDYKETYMFLKKTIGYAPTNGVNIKDVQKVLKALGWEWHLKMKRYTGQTIYLREQDLPSGIVICSLTQHLTTVINGTIFDTYDCSKNETRCVHGYWTKEN